MRDIESRPRFSVTWFPFIGQEADVGAALDDAEEGEEAVGFLGFEVRYDGGGEEGRVEGKERTNMDFIVVEAKVLGIVFPMNVFPDVVLDGSLWVGRGISS